MVYVVSLDKHDVKIVAQAFHVQKTSHVSNPCRPIAGSVDLLQDYKVSERNAMLTRDVVSIALYASFARKLFCNICIYILQKSCSL